MNDGVALTGYSGHVPRTLTIDRNRLPGWFERFEDRQGALELLGSTPESSLATEASAWTFRAPSGHLVAVDGAAIATLDQRELGPEFGTVTPPVTWQTLLERAQWDRHVGIILLRRGGYSVGIATGGRLVSSKSDTKYVQGRTAAGGWSQQRYQRRRTGQTANLLKSATHAATHLLSTEGGTGAPKTVDVLATGGDRPLLEALLAEPPLSPWARLPRVHVAVHGEPRQRDAAQVARETQALKVTITDPD